MQEADVKVDEGFASHLLAAVREMLVNKTGGEEEVTRAADVTVPLVDYRLTKLSTGDMVYARVLYIGPISLQVSYSSCPWLKAPPSGPASAGEQWAQTDEYLGYLSEINGLYINLGMLSLDDAYHSRQALTWLVVQHYQWQIVQGFLSLLGAVPVLGAPIEMFRGVATGVKGVFFLPALGVVRSPADFGDGLRQGSSALFQGTVGTVLKEIGKATSLASTVTAKLTLDEDYKREREQVAKRQAKTAGQGFLFAARDVGHGLWGGVSGVVMNPIRGAQRRGVAGFGMGLISGVLGAVTKVKQSALLFVFQIFFFL